MVISFLGIIGKMHHLQFPILLNLVAALVSHGHGVNTLATTRTVRLHSDFPLPSVGSVSHTPVHHGGRLRL